MASKVNKNEVPLRKKSQLSGAVKFSEYIDAEHFEHICTVDASEDQEKLIIREIHNNKKMARTGLVYVLVVNDLIFKIGHSINDFKNRLGSYNTGKMAYRSRGTNSGANFYILQSLINLKWAVEVYGYYPSKRKWNLFDENGKEPIPSSKTAEGVFLRRFKEEYNKLPLGCSQT